MAMSRPARPQLPVIGFVTAVTPRQAYDRENRRYTDEVIGYEVTVSQENGAQLLVRYGLDDRTPDVATRAGLIAEVNESREYGVTLAFLRPLTHDDLDRIASTVAVPAGK